ncbi:MAG: hypothetical protein H6581_29940 [Bacteroidia bacterium]|nr:hypothetical protein [Bacteroidia bacterium]
MDIQADFQFAGGSVLSVGAHVLTTGSPYEAEKEGKKEACAKIRVDQAERMKFFVGDEIELSPEEKLIVKAIILPKTKQERGKIYLDWAEKG